MSLPAVILEERVIPVARGLDATTAPALAQALGAGGIHSIEITFEAPGGLEAIAAVADGDLVVGAGTIVSVDGADRAVEAGARFLVSPHLDVALLEWAADNDVPLVPGALTPTEIVVASSHDPPAVKLFPASAVGPGYVGSLLGPYPDLALIPTGGVDAANIAAFLEAGAVAVGVGGWLTAHPDMSTVTARAIELRSRVV